MTAAEPIRRLTAACALSLLLSVASGCRHDAIGDVDASSATGRDAASTGPCAEAEDGDPCATHKYCVDGRCVASVCGDGVQTPEESCDDGNGSSGDGCSATCAVELLHCGDGKLDDGEECDDGNMVEQDGCASTCTRPVCGNQRVDVGEECDDGNRVDTDLCSNACLVVRCRNGRVDPGEQCDDGNQNPDDACSNECKHVPCGNGVIDPGESCDDGNRNDGDACPASCVASVCGDGKVAPDEVCENPEVIWSEAKAVWRDCNGCRSRSSQAMPGSCLSCMQQHCRSYNGLDLIAGCFERVDAESADPTDMFFLRDCATAVNCDLQHRAWTDSVLQGAQGYCGSVGLDMCSTNGPATDAPCVLEWQRAARSDSNSDVHARFSDLSRPSGWAFYLLKCILEGADGAGDNCKRACAPWAK